MREHDRSDLLYVSMYSKISRLVFFACIGRRLYTNCVRERFIKQYVSNLNRIAESISEIWIKQAHSLMDKWIANLVKYNWYIFIWTLYVLDPIFLAKIIIHPSLLCFDYMYFTNLWHLWVYYNTSYVLCDNLKHIYVKEKKSCWNMDIFLSFGYCHTRQSVLLFNWYYHETMTFSPSLKTFFLKEEDKLIRLF